MDLLVKITTLWLALDFLILATVWYAASTLQPRFPGWWRAVVCDRAPESFN